jgi:Flp pilus assembly protein TadD
MRWLLPLLLLPLLAACATPSSDSAGSGTAVADALLRSGSSQLALQALQPVLAQHPDDAAALAEQGDALMGLGRTDAAAESYRHALRSDPAFSRAQMGLGRILLSREPAEAERLFAEVARREPRNADALNDLGVARDLQGRHTDAQIAYRSALAADPATQGAAVNLALSLAMTGQGAEAERLLRPLAEAPAASRQLRHDLAAVLAMEGNEREAQRILAADLSPTEVRQALASFRAARTGTQPPGLTP